MSIKTNSFIFHSIPQRMSNKHHALHTQLNQQDISNMYTVEDSPFLQTLNFSQAWHFLYNEIEKKRVQHSRRAFRNVWECDILRREYIGFVWFSQCFLCFFFYFYIMRFTKSSNDTIIHRMHGVDELFDVI